MTTIARTSQLPKKTYFEQTTDAAKAEAAERAGRRVYRYQAATAQHSGPVVWFFCEMPGGLK